MIEKKLHYNFPYRSLIVFSIAMGVLEAIVVVYVRAQYYPEGFSFPLKHLPSNIVITEIIREIATLLMLGSVSVIAGKTFITRFSAFLFTFGIWDIIYYVALKLFLDWPESLLTYDILFLIPITWVGPVAAPVICSLIMIGIAVLFVNAHQRAGMNYINPMALAFMAAGALLIFFTFIYDFSIILIKGGYISKFSELATDTEFIAELESFVPGHFLWGLFFAGIILALAGAALALNKYRSNK